jgi:hypothetical protein
MQAGSYSTARAHSVIHESLLNSFHGDLLDAASAIPLIYHIQVILRPKGREGTTSKCCLANYGAIGRKRPDEVSWEDALEFARTQIFSSRIYGE